MIPEITKKYRIAQGINRAEFARALGEQIRQEVSRSSVSQWEKSKHAPEVSLLLLVAMRYSDWRRQWAFDCLAVLQPELYAPIEEAWK